MNNEKNIFIIALSIIVAGIIIGGAVLYVGSKNVKNQEAKLADTLPVPPDEEDILTSLEIPIGGHSFIGEADAPVTIVEVSDFECPFCGKFALDTMPKIKENFIDTGKVKFVFRDFPLPYHPNAQKAAEAALCYEDQGLDYYDIYLKLYENSNDLTLEKLKQYAKDLDADTEKFNLCLDENKFEQKVKEGFEEISRIIQESNIEGFGTPAFFVNGKPLIGAQDYLTFESMINDELEKLENKNDKKS